MTTTIIPFATLQLQAKETVKKSTNTVTQAAYDKNSFSIETIKYLSLKEVTEANNKIIYANEPVKNEPVAEFLAHFKWHLN